MTWFTENSTVPMVTGTLMVILLLVMAFSARETRILQLAFFIGLITAATVVCEYLIVTDREQVTETVYRLADLVEANDVPGVLSYVSKQRQDTRDRVAAEMPRYDFDNCRIIGVNYFESGNSQTKDTAEICFVVTVRVRLESGPETLFGQRRVILEFERDSDGQWRVIRYSHEDPRGGVGI